MIENQKEWEEMKAKNTDPYGGACVMVAEKAMEIIDRDYQDKRILETDVHGIICKADDESKAGGITGFMAGCAAQMISKFHNRGDEFRRAWNKDNQIQDEGEKANESGGVINPALVTVGSD